LLPPPRWQQVHLFVVDSILFRSFVPVLVLP
jgi:hypothetical protein